MIFLSRFQFSCYAALMHIQWMVSCVCLEYVLMYILRYLEIAAVWSEMFVLPVTLQCLIEQMSKFQLVMFRPKLVWLPLHSHSQSLDMEHAHVVSIYLKHILRLNLSQLNFIATYLQLNSWIAKYSLGLYSIVSSRTE